MFFLEFQEDPRGRWDWTIGQGREREAARWREGILGKANRKSKHTETKHVLRDWKTVFLEGVESMVAKAER